MRRQNLLTRLGGRSREPGPVQRAVRLTMVALLMLPQVALPATITVDGTGSETTTNGVCSIREAINNANNDDAGFADCAAGSGPDTIEITNSIALTDIDHDDRGLPLITTDITIEGGGFTIERNVGFGIEDFAIFKVATSGTLSVNDTTVANGATPDGLGGGIWNNGGVLNMTNTTISNNSAYLGGGMCTDNGGTATLVDCAISGNYGAFAGGVIISDYYSDPGVDFTTATLTNTTLTDNSAIGGGGIISQVFAETTMNNSTVSGNSAVYAGGVYSYYLSPLTVNDSTISGNTASTGAGVFGSTLGVLTVVDSTVKDNVAYYGAGGAPGSGAGLFSNAYSSVTAINSTISGNSAASNGGGSYSAFVGSVTLTNSTMVGNSADGAGGGVFTTLIDGAPYPSYTNLANAIVADNLGGDCAGDLPATDLGNNFSSDGSCPGSDLITPGVDFDTTLADNGGPTETHALFDGSVAIEAAVNCGLATDQRGEPRCFACDSGSYELLVDVDAGCDCILLDAPSKVFVDQEFELDMSCANPDSRVLVTAGRNDDGSVRVVPGCGPVQFGVGPRANNFGAVTADSEGNATSSQTLGGPFGNETIYFEALDLSKCEVSPVRSIFVNKAPDAPDMSGLSGRAAAARQRISGSSRQRMRAETPLAMCSGRETRAGVGRCVRGPARTGPGGK